MSTPSIQSFFRKTSSIDSGFTTAELSTSNPLSRAWEPPVDTGYVSIANITQGKGHIYFKGRIVNFRPAVFDRHSAQYLKAWHYLVIKDDSGAIGVKLMPLGIPSDTFSLGQLVSPSPNQDAVPFVLTCTSINPGPGTRQFLCIEPESPESQRLYRLPLDLVSAYESLKGLVTLDSFIKTGHDDVSGLRILVCKVVVFDHTTSCVMSLWETQTKSTTSWIPETTILLLTSPKWKPWNRPTDSASEAKGSIALDHRTLVEVDPDFEDAAWLRRWAENRTKKDVISLKFPSYLWDVDAAMNGPVRALFPLPSVVIVDTSMADLWFKKTFCCTTCCGVTLYSNADFATCKHCQIRRELYINPRIIGTMVDETGCLEKSKTVWNDQAWMELLFPGSTTTPSAEEPTSEEESEETASEEGSEGSVWEEGSKESVTSRILTRISAQGLQSVREAEVLLQQARVTLTFGRSSQVGRLCILGVEW
ncbi:hypothetical protein F5X68DRAFT_250020 [Plectosphaerella plurivora]|uniref:Uncharacterized protein n=1 Tax=Plectosphaerella plurivora TaxID=936078 RepID=A0A9P8V1U9_9PEZI|nr:hypothetical protein F5X68DRAFT_250020 [Plectosphaerella plurivora]